MRFLKYLRRNMHAPYKYNYLDYKGLRAMLKAEGYGTKHEEAFIDALESNMERVFDFVKSKHDELLHRLKRIERRQGGKNMVEDVLEELKYFSEFVRINIIGFKKVLNRHDRDLEPKLLRTYKPFLRDKIALIKELDELMYSASKIILKSTKTKKARESGSSFVRRTDKYWVHRENVISLKFLIIQHLPIHVFSNEPVKRTSPYGEWNHETHDRCVSSVYFDTVGFDLYRERLHKTHHSEAIRIRWYTRNEPDVVFVERKRHEDGWTGESSKKLRFKIPEEHVLDYANGGDVWKHVAGLNKGEDVRQLYEEIQHSITSQRLRPVVRTYYKRTAFQLPNDSAVRISLDTELCMIRECGVQELEDPGLPIASWRRKDVGCEYPFRSLGPEEIVRFPHAILEVKTQSIDETKPRWIEEIIEGPLVEHVHKFSKYLHGCAVLYPSSVSEIPYWLPQCDTDIRKDAFEPDAARKMFMDTMLVEVPAAAEALDSERLSPVDVHDKRIAIPIRVEPKVFFANERTFLSWVQFAIFLGGIGTAMLGMGDENADLSGVVLIIVSVIFALYALYLYLWRAGMIRKRETGPYDDIYGPPILVIVFLLAMAISVIFKFPLRRA
jgi:SPX domain protein involved in polyphosphate accumulation/uncharacterized membrane protein YidH (DUF202 family)